MPSILRALILGDVIGQPGCRALFFGLKKLIKATKADFVVVNGENAADGYGLTPELAERLFLSGVDVITSGNHIWQKQEIYPLLESENRILRPENYPNGVPGKGHCIVEKNGTKIAVLNLEGRVYLSNIRCPFRVGKELATRLQNITKIIILDFHAEWPEEKEALAIYLDGKISILAGTHTHVQTADERILPGGTGYITDIGMSGPAESVIGMKIETAVKRGLTQMPLKLEVAENPVEICGTLVEIDKSTGHSVSIKRIREKSSI